MCERTRVETNYRNVTPSKDGSFSVYIRPEINAKLDMYCRLLNLNKTAVTNELVNKALDDEFKQFVAWKTGQQSL